SLFAPILTPTMPPRRARASRRFFSAAWPSLLKPSRLMTARWSGRRKTRGRGLPACGSGVTVPTSAKPMPSASIASGTSPFLSKPAAMPTGFVKCSPKRSTPRETGSSPRSRGPSPMRSARIVMRCAFSGSIKLRKGRTNGKKSISALRNARHIGGENMCAFFIHRQGINAAHRLHRQDIIEMREKRATTRRLPFERLTESGHFHRNEEQSLAAGEMALCCFRCLCGGREMDEAVINIDSRTDEATLRLRDEPFMFADDLVDETGTGRHGTLPKEQRQDQACDRSSPASARLMRVTVSATP